MRKIFYSSLAFVFLLVAFTTNSFADIKNMETKVEAIFDKDVNYKSINEGLSSIEKSLLSGKATTYETVGYIKSLTKIQNQTIDVKKQVELSLTFVQKRVEALGEEPQNGKKEDAKLANKRKEFNAEASFLKTNIAEADVILAKIDELENLILSTRNRELLDAILDRQVLLLDPSHFFDYSIEFVKYCFDIIKSPFDWYQNLSSAEKKDVKDNMGKVSLTILISLFAAIYLSLFIQRHFGYRKNIENPDYGNKTFAAIFVSIAYGLIPAAIIGAFLFWTKKTAIINIGFFGQVINSLALYLLYILLSRALVKVTFTPNNGKWRLIEVSDDKAKRVSRASYLSIIIFCLFSFLETNAIDAKYSSELVYYIKMLSNVAKAFCLIFITQSFFGEKYTSDNSAEIIDDEMETDDDDDEELSLSSKITIFTSIFVMGIFSISLFGYVSLSEFVLNRFMISIVVIGSFYILNKAIKVLFHRILLFRFWTRKLKVGRRTLVKIDLFFGLLLNPIMIFVGSMILLGLWGVSIDLLLQNIKKFLTEFYVGGVRISIISILFGIFVFFVSLAIFKTLRRSLLLGVLMKFDIDDGVRNSLSSGFNFFGFIISVLFAIVVMGGSIGSLALIAGALSFGVGLGMQNIVSNFVSGIIILFERPMKIGDSVIINGQEGVVKQINIRATEIETGDKTSVIVPNATILSNSLINLTHHNKHGRVDIKVGVGYESNLKEVKRILLEIAKDAKYVMTNPASYVSFTNLGDSSLDFELRCYVADIGNKSNVSNYIREEIVNRFREAGIDIPFPQRVVRSM